MEGERGKGGEGEEKERGIGKGWERGGRREGERGREGGGERARRQERPKLKSTFSTVFVRKLRVWERGLYGSSFK